MDLLNAEEVTGIHKNEKCKNVNCFISMGICGAYTFGVGDLSPEGYFSKPCHECARKFERDHPKSESIGSCWPPIATH